MHLWRMCSLPSFVTYSSTSVTGDSCATTAVLTRFARLNRHQRTPKACRGSQRGLVSAPSTLNHLGGVAPR
ncbi:hypothetical protein F5Y18DRAFT_390189 [Xylariaceae sp. FL1019]|nr:hypothetical protein F5Y18DRAFT_390189 [Xylariaceae sp. FL1019]